MSTDYASRDGVVRHDFYTSVRRRDGLSEELFQNYWRDVHATLRARLPGLATTARSTSTAGHSPPRRRWTRR